MFPVSRVESILERYIKGETGLTRELLGTLASEMLVVPVVSFSGGGAGSDTRRVTVVTFVDNGRRCVPAFTSEDQFLEWAGENYQCFSVVGADLGITLPKNTHLLINPDSALGLELTPEHVAALADIADGIEVDTNSLPTFGTGRTLSVPDAPVANGAESRYGPQDLDTVEAEPELPEPPSIEELLEELRQTLMRYSAVQEAYFVPGEKSMSLSDRGAPLVGLLLDSVNLEERFKIIGEIAEISRRRFGEAGAIEVFDDLNSKTSASWDLFYTQVPFFVREATPVDAPLAEQITYDVQHIKEKKLPADDVRENELSEAGSKVQILKKRLFEGLSRITSR